MPDEIGDVNASGNPTAQLNTIAYASSLISNHREMSSTQPVASALEPVLSAHRASIMAGRPDERPRLFKQAQNCAAATVFVVPDLV